MQLYRIHENPAENASLIGVYANKINVAEGLQQISDIGHCLGITWPGQYKASYVRTAHGTGKRYISHPLVMGHMRERQTFLGLCSVVEESLDWLEDNGHEKWCSKRRSVWESLCESGVKYIADALPDHRTPFEFQAEYLVNIKRFDASGKALVTDEEARIIQEEVLTNDTEGGAMIEVSKERFDDFINEYPLKLDKDFFMNAISYNDFSRGVWPESMVAMMHLPYSDDEDPIYKILGDS